MTGRTTTLLLSAIVAFCYLTQLGSYPLLEPDEGRYGEIAREMAQPGGDWLIPHLNGIPHFQKPPVFYWFMAGSVKLFGATEIGVRLPVALSALGVLFLTMGIANRLSGQKAGRFAFVILASTPLFLVLGRTATPDMTMTLWITAAIYCLVRAREGGPWRWLFFVCAGLGFLTKGPVAFLVPFSTAIGFALMLRKSEGNRLSLPWIRGLVISLLIGLSWFLVACSKYPELIDYFWKYELVERFGSSNHGRSRPIWFFIPVLIGGLLPWIWAMFPAAINAFKKRPPELWLHVGWIVFPFLVLSCSGSKLPTYVLPLFPGFAVALGSVLAKALAQSGRRSPIFVTSVRELMALILIVLSALPIVVTLFALKPAGIVSAGMLVWALFLAAAATGWFLFARRRESSEKLTFAFAGLVIVGLLPIPFHLESWNDMLAQQASVKTLAARIQSESDRSGSAIPPRVISCEIRANGLPFYLGQTVEITRSSADIVPVSTDSAVFKSIQTPLHKNSKQVAKLASKKEGAPIFVVIRRKQYQRDFADKGWEILEAAGDFLLLRREALNPPQTANPIPNKVSGYD